MSRFRERCGELRARVWKAGSLGAVSSRRDMPANDNLRSHVVGECTCEPDLPPLEFVGKGAGGEWRFSSTPACQICETDLLVDRVVGPDHDALKCHGCSQQTAIEEYLDQYIQRAGAGVSEPEEVDA